MTSRDRGLDTSCAMRRAVARIDLSADLGEGYDDAAIVPLLTSASIACGAHAGDDRIMRATISLAARHRVAIGAHPGFPDRTGFGRRVTTRDPAEIESLVAAQVEVFAAHATDLGRAVVFAKPHGALYNLAAVDEAVARAIARGVRRALPGRPVVGLAGSLSLVAARAEGLRAVAEAFADRAYLADGTLMPRGTPGATIPDADEAARRAVAIAVDGRVATVDGGQVRLRAETICLHGDTPGAARIARRVREALLAARVDLEPFAG